MQSPPIELPTSVHNKYRLTRPVCATAPMTSDWLACLRCMHMHRHIEGSTSSDCWTAARLCTRVVAAASYVHLMT
jgi:hypothetical protein